MGIRIRSVANWGRFPGRLNANAFWGCRYPILFFSPASLHPTINSYIHNCHIP